jgi:hypothetical protein
MFPVRYNERVPKRLCTNRAEWRLQPGKPAETLSPHYRLDCDYGTAVITCWEEGGSEPIYVCESHAKQLARPRKRVTDIRIVTPESAAAEFGVIANPIEVQDRTPVQELAAPTAAALPPEAAAAPALESDPCNDPVQVQDRVPMPEVIAPAIEAAPGASKSAVPPEPARSLPEIRVARAIDPPARSPARDLAYGNPAKAMVDEAIWNLATGNHQAYKTALQQGKSAAEAAKAAGGQLAMVHRKISDYTNKLENLLSASGVKISAAETIDKPLEQAMLEIIGNGVMSDSEKDAVIQQLGSLQEWVKHGLQGDIAPLQANRILLAIGDRLNWGATSSVPEEFKPIYRTLYGNLKTAIRAAVPEAQNLHERLTNLYAAKSDLEVR